MRPLAAPGLHLHDEPVRVPRVHPDAPAAVADEPDSVPVAQLSALHGDVLPGALHPVREDALVAVTAARAAVDGRGTVDAVADAVTPLGRQRQRLVSLPG